MKEYIERSKVLEILECRLPCTDESSLVINGALGITETNVRRIPAADVVEITNIEAWLYELAMNNVGVAAEDFAVACEEITKRLDGLRAFARDRRTALLGR